MFYNVFSENVQNHQLKHVKICGCAFHNRKKYKIDCIGKAVQQWNKNAGSSVFAGIRRVHYFVLWRRSDTCGFFFFSAFLFIVSVVIAFVVNRQFYNGHFHDTVILDLRNFYVQRRKIHFKNAAVIGNNAVV